jgi:hypothetical protein
VNKVGRSPLAGAAGIAAVFSAPDFRAGKAMTSALRVFSLGRVEPRMIPRLP